MQWLWLLSWCIAHILSDRFLVSATEFGVGFHLSLDYGVASIYFANGSTVALGKILGGTEYRRTMWEVYVGEPDELLEYGTRETTMSLRQDWQDLDFLGRMPLWPGKRQPSSLAPMVKSLKASAETYLERPILEAQVVASFPTWTLESFEADIRSAFAENSLRIPGQIAEPAGIMAARFHTRDECERGSDLYQLALTVEYNKAVLVALIVFQLCDYDDYRRILYDTELGSDHVRDIAGQERLEVALRNFVQFNSSSDGGFNELDPANLSNLYLLGESAGDSRLHEALKNALGEPQWQYVEAQDNKGTSVDPLFAGSSGSAIDCWLRTRKVEDGTADI